MSGACCGSGAGLWAELCRSSERWKWPAGTHAPATHGLTLLAPPASIHPASKWLLAMQERREYERRNEAIDARQALEQQFSQDEGEGGGGGGGGGGSGGAGRKP